MTDHTRPARQSAPTIATQVRRRVRCWRRYGRHCPHRSNYHYNRGASLVDHLDTRANGLNLLRLLLASSVIFWHTYAVQGREFGDSPFRPLVSEVGVDGFFAISGFLILMSWHRRPQVREFLAARVLRIMPAFYVVLLATVLVFAPLGVAIQGGSATSLLTDPAAYGYFYKNIFLWIFDPGVAGTPIDVLYVGSWNASLWTLAWEFACYLGVLFLGVTRLADRRWVIASIFFLMTFASAATAGLHIESHNVLAAARLGLMFSAGMVLYAYQDAVKINVMLAAAAVALIGVSLTLPDYRILGALPLAYLLLAVGGALRHPAFWFRTDVSYGVYVYAFPVQQLLVIAGLGSIAVGGFALLALAITLPLAWLSWILVEKPALRLKRRLGGARPQVRVEGPVTTGR